MDTLTRSAPTDPAQVLARVSAERREQLLVTHGRRLPREELEDCYAQATLELLARARRPGAGFAGPAHAANALELRLRARIADRQRAVAGRCAIEAALAAAAHLDVIAGPGALVDHAPGVEERVIARLALAVVRELWPELTADQRLVLGAEATLGIGAAELGPRIGWSYERARKVGQRGRARLRALVEEHERGERCARLRPAVIAAAGAAGEGRSSAWSAVALADPGAPGFGPAGSGTAGSGAEAVRRHLRGCASCRGVFAARRRAAATTGVGAR